MVGGTARDDDLTVVGFVDPLAVVVGRGRYRTLLHPGEGANKPLTL